MRVHLEGARNWIFRAERRYLDPKRKYPTMSIVTHHLVHLNSHLEVYIVRHTHRTGKKHDQCWHKTNVSFYGTYGCSNLSLSSHRWVLGKWMSKNPNFKSNDNDNNDDDEDDNDDADDETLPRGCCVKRRTRHATRVHLGGAWNWTFRAERRYLDPKREHPTMSMIAHHLVHLNSHLEVYIVRHTHRAGEKNTISVSTNSNVSFCGNLSLSLHRCVLGKCRMMMVMRRRMMMLMMMKMVMMTRHCEGAAA